MGIGFAAFASDGQPVWPFGHSAIDIAFALLQQVCNALEFEFHRSATVLS